MFVDLDVLFAALTPVSPPPTAASAPGSDPTSTPARPAADRSAGAAAADETVGEPAGEGFVGRDIVPPPMRHPGRVVCSGEVPGQLHGWERADDDGRPGPWVAVVSFAMPYRDDLRPVRKMAIVAVPAAAVRPADPDSAPPRSPDVSPPPWRSSVRGAGPAP